MRRKSLIALGASVVVVAAAHAASSTVSSSVPAAGDGKVGLVLSGGGAKGVAHIGVIQAFEENNIPIDYITGTSMGAIVGSLYASGYSPAEMMGLLASKGFAEWSAGKISPDRLYYALSDPENPSFVNINLGQGTTGVKSALPSSLINPIPMNMAFLEIYSRYTAQCGGDFDRLFVPFRCVTSDVWAHHKVVMRKGSLADAVRMSMSFPMVFEPIELNGVPMFDGGLYDNYPVDVMVDDFNPQYIIGVNVGSPAPKPSTNPMNQLDAMIQQPQDYPFPDSRGVNIRIDLDEFSLLDFPKAAEIYAIGYRRGLEMVDSIKRRIAAVAPARLETVNQRRAAFRAATPEVKIAGVSVEGGTPGENACIEQLFRPPHGRSTITMAEATDAYYRAISTGRLQNLVPTPVYNPSDSTFTLRYRAVVKEHYGVGIGGYISSSTMSMLFFQGSYNSLGFKSITAGVNGWVGQSYLAAEATGTYSLNTARPMAVTLRGVASRHTFHETERLFYEFHDPDFIRRSQVFGQMRLTLGPTQRTRIDLQLGGGHLTDTYLSDLLEGVDTRDTGTHDLWQAALRWERNTLDNSYAPTSGSYLRATGMAVTGRYRYHGADPSDRLTAKENWVQLDIDALHYWPIGRRLSLGTEVRALVSSRHLLPTYQASIVAAEAIHPTPSSYNLFCRSLRANSFISATLQPVVKISDSFQLRALAAGFLPGRRIEPNADNHGAHYGRRLGNPEVFTELQARLHLPIGTVSAYGNYTSGGPGWNFGISIGTFILAPHFLE